jgi:hypothetical protein
VAKQDGTTCRHGLWPSSPIVDGRFGDLLSTYFQMLEELGAQLAQAEEAAVRGSGAAEQRSVTGVPSSPVEGRLGRDGRLADQQVRELRKIRGDWLKRLQTLVHAAQSDLGLRQPIQGPRDRQGRLKILTSNRVSEQGVK